MPQWLTIQNALVVLGVIGFFGNAAAVGLTSLTRIWPALAPAASTVGKWFIDFQHFFPPPVTTPAVAATVARDAADTKRERVVASDWPEKRGYIRIGVMSALAAVASLCMLAGVASSCGNPNVVPNVVPPATTLVTCVTMAIVTNHDTLSQTIAACGADAEAVILAIIESVDPQILQSTAHAEAAKLSADLRSAK